jgi:hypothetical protein
MPVGDMQAGVLRPPGQRGKYSATGGVKACRRNSLRSKPLTSGGRGSAALRAPRIGRPDRPCGQSDRCIPASKSQQFVDYLMIPAR